MAKKEGENLPIQNNLASQLATHGIEVQNIPIEELSKMNLSDFIDVGKIKLELKEKEAFLGVFIGFETHLDERKGNEFCVSTLESANKADTNQYFITMNEVMKPQLEKIAVGNTVLITCLGEGENANGKFKKWNIKQHI